jgi:hypothetical protein
MLSFDVELNGNDVEQMKKDFMGVDYAPDLINVNVHSRTDVF